MPLAELAISNWQNTIRLENMQTNNFRAGQYSIILLEMQKLICNVSFQWNSTHNTLSEQNNGIYALTTVKYIFTDNFIQKVEPKKKDSIEWHACVGRMVKMHLAEYVCDTHRWAQDNRNVKCWI